MSKLLVLIVVCCFPAIAFSQPDSVLSAEIEEVQVSHSAVDKYLRSVYVQKVDSVVLESNAHLSIASTLSQSSPIYIKQDLPGLATLSIRGTGADHTAMMWGEININSLTLGHSNLANLSSFLFDDINVIYGSTGALVGADAMGGAIVLDSKIKRGTTTSIELLQTVASFKSYFSGAKIYMPFGKFSSLTRVYNNDAKNNFTFENRINNKLVVDTQQNAALHNYGLIQDFNYKLSQSTDITAKLWFESNTHQIALSKSANAYSGVREEIYNTHIRSQLQFATRFADADLLKITTAYIRDFEIYNHHDTIAMQTMVFKPEYNYSISNNIHLKVGEEVRYSTSDVYSYEKQISELRAEAFASFLTTFKKFSITLSYRNTSGDSYTMSHIPAATFLYNHIRGEYLSIKERFTYAKAYKIPTFNDRYWGNQGNPNLLPESGETFETGYDIAYSKSKVCLKYSGNLYYKNIDDWIQWTDMGSDWYPSNYKKVESIGFEQFVNFAQTINKAVISISANYSYNSVQEVVSYGAISQNLNKQLLYAPKYIAGSTIVAQVKTWSISTHYAYHGKVYVANDINYEGGRQSLSAYSLVDFSLVKAIRCKAETIKLSATINNVFDVSYQQHTNYAAPGRNYSVSIKLNIN